jgi:hypothetical protein
VKQLVRLADVPTVYVSCQGQGICRVSRTNPLSLSVYGRLAPSLLCENCCDQNKQTNKQRMPSDLSSKRQTWQLITYAGADAAQCPFCGRVVTCLTADSRKFYHFAILMSPCLVVNICDRQPPGSWASRQISLSDNTNPLTSQQVEGQGTDLLFLLPVLQHSVCTFVGLPTVVSSVADVTFLDTPEVGKLLFCKYQSESDIDFTAVLSTWNKTQFACRNLYCAGYPCVDTCNLYCAGYPCVDTCNLYCAGYPCVDTTFSVPDIRV